MVGGKITAGLKVGRRGGTLLLALTALLIPLFLLTIDEGHAADEVPASVRYAVGSPGMLAAQDIARRQWGTDPCGGVIDVQWGADEPLINARSYWANPRSAYDNPDLNVQCRVVFNQAMTFSWEKFCTVLVHEYGHLAGRPHSADGPDLMSPIYRAPLPACSAVPDPAATAASTATTAAPAALAVGGPTGAAPAAATAAPATAPATRRASARRSRAAAKARAQAKAAKAKATKPSAATARAASAPLLRFDSADEHEH